MPINIDGSKGIRQNTTEVTKIPVGTTAQRPANPDAGMIRFNTDRGFVEWYDPIADIWSSVAFDVAVVATGGTVTDIEQDGKKFRVHTFTSDGTFEVTRSGKVEYLVVGGGGGGSGHKGGSTTSHGAGGGGAGGLLSGVNTVSVSSFSVLVGEGGTGGEGLGGTGGDSILFGETAIGGGRGAHRFLGENGGSGGSGGGASNDGFGGSGSTGQGNDGGDGRPAGGSRSFSGGGGGAGQRGGDNRDVGGGVGGDGLEISITGIPIFYAGGGGGGSGTSDLSGDGGNGGGGKGGQHNINNGAAISGIDGLGGGGGGSSSNNSISNAVGGSGGSGIVIVRYRIG